MTVTGHSIIAGVATPGLAKPFSATDPATAATLDPPFSGLDIDQVGHAAAAASEALEAYRATAPQERAEFLDAIAQEIEALGDELVERAHAESGLPLTRLTGERGRTCAQLRMFAEVVRVGDHRGVRVDPAMPDRSPLPRPDLRVQNLPVGPVAIFGASNFPLAFSTAGGDTASALAAGCPVVVKGHPAHPGTAELVGRAVVRAAERTGMPAGVFSLVQGAGNEVGQALVSDPRIAAVGFTGSRAGGLALVATAAARSVPIPVYAEMSSVNPVVLLPGSLDGNVAGLAASYVASLLNGSGQFCTNPGLLFMPVGKPGDALLREVQSAVDAATGQTMLTPGIRQSFEDGVARIADHPRVTKVGHGVADGPNAPGPVVFMSDLADFDADLAHEVFGAVGLIVRYDRIELLAAALERLEGQLTATLHGSNRDHNAARLLLPILENRAGRVLWGGWPTGVEVAHAMVHGGPFPATSDGRSTSVGSLAIERWQRPVCYQGFPAELLSEALHDENPWGLSRRVNGRRTAS